MIYRVSFQTDDFEAPNTGFAFSVLPNFAPASERGCPVIDAK
ncbi:MAG TPA: hypothetical protein VF644_15145 [Pyrinomonadaceae bacterium]|jgi:hypothetical protein